MRQWAWAVFLVVAGAVFSLVLGCGMPLAAFGAVAALSLRWLPALACAALLWLANEALTHGILTFPHAALWIAAMAAVTLACVVAPRAAPSGPWRWPLGFMLGFLAYEAGLYAAARLLGGGDVFTSAFLLPAFAQNAVCFALLGAVRVVSEGRSMFFFEKKNQKTFIHR
jgi:hypothetical protein